MRIKAIALAFLFLLAHGCTANEEEKAANPGKLVEGLDPGAGFFNGEVGPDGTMHFVYYNNAHPRIEHADNMSGTWSATVVDADHIESYRSSMDLDANGAVHIVYFASVGSGDVLRYATNKTGNWKKEPVVDATSFCDPSITVAKDGTPHISYCKYDMGGPSSGRAAVHYGVRNADGTWSTEVIDTSAIAQQTFVLDTSIFVDPNGVPSILYTYLNSDATVSLKFARKDAVWTKETVDEIGEQMSGAIAPDGTIGVVYMHNDEVRCATYRSGTWTQETVKKSIEQELRLPPVVTTVDAASNFHALFGDRTINDQGFENYDLDYVTNTNGSWAVEVMANGPRDESAVAIGVDGQGKVQMYYNDQEARLRLIVK
ncbi:MAG: hypothetical protein KAI47_20865 [Deltaproteobacteria bacterium]|nr:hypothetical protein [Deltaproteobacteria bacterium]